MLPLTVLFARFQALYKPKQNPLSPSVSLLYTRTTHSLFSCCYAHNAIIAAVPCSQISHSACIMCLCVCVHTETCVDVRIALPIDFSLALESAPNLVLDLVRLVAFLDFLNRWQIKFQVAG